MKRSPPEILNKEKVLFVLFALIFSAALYRVIASAPLPLESGKPLTEKSGPEVLCMADADTTLAERDYFRGSRNPMRKPSALIKLPPLLVDLDKKNAGGEIPSPPREKNHEDEAVSAKWLFEPKSLGLEYMGIVIADGKSCALLRSKKSAATQRVLSGENVAGTNVSVTKIEPWAVWLSDGQGVGVLKNERFDAAKPESASRAVKSRNNREPSVFF